MRYHAKSLVRVLKNTFGLNAKLMGAEVGVWRGELSGVLLGALPNLTLYMVDYWQINDSMKATQEDVDAAKVTAGEVAKRHNKRSVILGMTSLSAADYLRGVALDFVFLDANHHYEHVRDDIAAWLPLVRSGGVIAGHDYNGVMDLCRKWGVKKAVDEAFDADNIRTERGHVWWVQL